MSNNSGEGAALGWLILIAFVALIGWIVFSAGIDRGQPIGYRDGYRQGQIDALTGRVAYELKTNPDRSVVWVKKAEAKP